MRSILARIATMNTRSIGYLLVFLVPLLALPLLLPTRSDAVDLIHNSADTASSKWQAQGGWGVAGGKYGKFTCATCHAPDSDNLKNIKPVISTMNGDTWPNGAQDVQVVFLNQTGMGDDTRARGSSNRICEVCHSQNRFHNFDSANNTEGLGHPTPKDICTNCHKHNTGFKAGCGGCHGNPPTSAVFGTNTGLIGLPRPSRVLEPGQVGAHHTHTQVRNMVCDTCHYIDNGSIKMPNQSGTIQIGFFGFGGKVTNGTYVPYSSATRGFPFASGTAQTMIAQAKTTYEESNRCQNVYCHGGGAPGHSPLGGGLNQQPRWDAQGQNACGNCHGTTNDNPPTLGSHVKHTGSAAGFNGYAFQCSTCHPATDVSHVQGSVRWQFGANNDPRVAAALYRAAGSLADEHAGATNDLAPSPTYGQCSNVACHSDGKSGTPRVAPVWGDSSFPTDCSGCHGGNAGSVAPMATGRHAAHINNAGLLGVNYNCDACHARTVTGDITMSGRGNHVNLLADYSGAKAGNGSTYTGATGVCSASYCHTDGKGTQKMTTASGWNSGAGLDCKGCHGSDATPDFSGIAGEPNYVTTGAGAVRANSHKKHVGSSGAATCVYCHSATVVASGDALTGNHTNMVIDVQKGGGKNFDYIGAKTCANISCHGSGSVNAVWGDTFPSDCTGCHGGNASTGAKWLKTGMHTQHLNNATVNGENFGCAECHALTVSSDQAVVNQTLHGNGFVDFSGARAGKNSAACNSAYCHSDGKGGTGMAVSWISGPAIINCKGCHGASATPAFASVAGEPNYASSGQGLLYANSHEKHVGVSGASTCGYCHAATTTDGISITTPANHLNRSIEVAKGGGKSFDYPGGKTCSNISCHGTGSADAVWGATMPTDCTGCHGGNSSSANPIATGKHSAHINQAAINGDNITCSACHARTVTADRSIASIGNHGNGFADYSGLYSGKNSTACNTAYCHSDGKAGAGVAVSWSAGPVIDNCIGCHGAATGSGTFTSIAGEPNYANAGINQLYANSHKAHTATGATSCDTCHTDTVTAGGTAIKAGSLHLNGTRNVNFNRANEATASWNGVNVCSNITCHSGGNATWGDPSSAGCKVCHANLSSGHAKHIGNLVDSGIVTFYQYTANKSVGTSYRFGCANCHPTDPSKHRNGTIDLTLAANKVGASYLNSLNNQVTTDSGGYTKGSGSLTCETVYCHSNGRALALAPADYRQTPNWYGGAFGPNRCGSCHDNPPQYAGQSHYNPQTAIGNVGKAPYRETGHMVGIHFMNTGKGNKQNGFLGFSSVGSMAHGNDGVATTISCYICHSGIASSTAIDTYAMDGSSSLFRCAGCHNSSTRTPLQTGLIANTALHVNGSKDVQFAPITFKTKAQLSNVANALGWTRNGNYKSSDSYDSFDLSVASWDPATKTCLTACHVNQPDITWGGQLKCVSCHARQ
ncbi:geobacter CxxxxCH...CXXCH motif protein [Geobacter sp. OR-1]|uniref:CxxxxCH/CxxCH domain c-type cytochrome n=1 Tax=Geobacter sp. OR-1 TaxID=1266765 RepID=UPI0005442F46|nr:CxxxxCH/CxxCH domain-containing protein [Geobacter sp. OR-1]GAM09959.1 geobacter CxxxxCH...CXXCH motif protein [Geobacter sp. OR-1]